MRIPMIKGYNIPSALTIQPPRVSIVTAMPVVSDKQVFSMMRKFVGNEGQYRLFKNLNAKASLSGLRLNMRFTEQTPGKIAIDVADESLATDREFVDIASKIVNDKIKNIFVNIKDAAETLANCFNSNKKGGVKTVIIDPSEKYALKISDAIDEVIVKRELAKHK